MNFVILRAMLRITLKITFQLVSINATGFDE